MIEVREFLLTALTALAVFLVSALIVYTIEGLHQLYEDWREKHSK